MALNHKEIKKIAHLARIAVSPEDISSFADDLNNILEFIAQMQAVDTADIEPLAHPHDFSPLLRDDEADEKIARDKYQKIAPLTERGLYLVPTVIE